MADLSRLNVSLNGPDGVGKSTHCRLLHWETAPQSVHMGGLQIRRSLPPSMTNLEFANWWFRDCPVDDLVKRIRIQQQARSSRIPESGRLVLLDRGDPMVEAVCIATVMARTQKHFHDAQSFVLSLAELCPAPKREGTIDVLLIPSRDPATSLDLTLRRLGSASDAIYRAYQQHLNSVLFHQIEQNRYDEVVYCEDATIARVQSLIRLSLNRHSLALPPFGANLHRIIGFGGLSESGKSTSADYLMRRYGVQRLKIRYLLEVASARWSLSPSDLDQPQFAAELIADELNKFSARHHYQHVYSIESLHYNTVARHLKTIFGPDFIAAYLDADPAIRTARSNDPDATIRKDALKCQRGADLIASWCDYRIRNDRDRVFLGSQLDTMFAAAMGFERLPVVHCSETEIAMRLLDRLRQALGQDLLLFAVTGSAARNKSRPGWSDLDILILITPGRYEKFVSVAADLVEASGIKVGFTVITPAECKSGTVDSKTVHHLRLLCERQIAAQFANEGTQIPRFTMDQDIRSSLGFLPKVLHKLRRALLHRDDPKRLFKLLMLVSKILLLANAEEVHDYSDIACKMERRFSGFGCPPLPSISDAQQHAARIAQACFAFLSWFELYYEPSGRLVAPPP